MHRSTVLLALFALPLACATSAKEPVVPPSQVGPSSTPRFDGVYESQPGKAESKTGEQGLDLLRFLGDGRVLSLSTSSVKSFDSAVRLLLAESDRCATGKYEIKEGVLRFVMTSKLGSVEYAGAVRDDRLVVRWRSAINGASVEETFSFIRAAEDASPPPEKIEKAEKTEKAEDAEIPSGPTVPESALIPDGSAWFCFRTPAASVSRCERKVAACDAARKSAASSHKDAKLTRCTKQASAYCFTVVQKSAARGAASCSATEDDCKVELAGRGAERDAADVAISTCARH